MERAQGNLNVLLDKIEAGPELKLNSVDFSFRNDPELLAARLGPIFHTISRVEKDVSYNVEQIRTLLRDPGPVIERFLGLWVPEELRHGEIMDIPQQLWGIEPYQSEPRPVGWKIEVGGELSRISILQRTLSMVYATMGAKNERLTGVVYRKLDEALVSMGETTFVETALKRIRPQEGAHDNFYSSLARNIWQEMGRVERKLARIIIPRIWQPVGIGSPEHELEIKHVFDALGKGDEWQFIQPIERISRQLLGEDYDTTYVARGIARIIDLPLPEPVEDSSWLAA